MELIRQNSTFNCQSINNIYRVDVVKFLKEKEQSRIYFRHRSPQIKFRQILIKFMKKVTYRNKLSLSCLHLAIYILDIFMDNHNIHQSKLKLVAMVCIYLSAKLEENSIDVPKLTELNELINEQYPIEEYKNLENLMFQYFHYKLNFPCPIHFVSIYLQELHSFENFHNNQSLIYNFYQRLLIYLNRILEDVHFLTFFAPSKLAAALIVASQIDNGITVWNERLQNLTNYKKEDFEEITQYIMSHSKLICSKCIEIIQ